MGFMDKAREGARQATAKAQQGFAKGQAKLDDLQASRAADGLLRDLGTAFYAEQRSGGAHEAVVAALGAVDAHVGAHGPLGKTAAGSPVPAPQTPAQPSAPVGLPAAGPAAEPSVGSPAEPSAGPPARPSAGSPTPGGSL